MKKSYILALVAFLFISVPAKSQIEFGVKGGLNISNFSFDKKVFDKSNQTGFFIGPTVKFSLPVVGFDISALYDQRSADLSVYMTTPETLAKETIKQQQIVIPVNARFSFGLGETASIFFFAGPQFGFNLGGGVEVENGELQYQCGTRCDVVRSFASFCKLQFCLRKDRRDRTHRGN